MKKIILLLIIFIAVVGLASRHASAKSNFFMVKLPRGVSFEIPRNWKILTNDQLITFDTVVESQIDLSKLPMVNSRLNFVAGYADDEGDKAKVYVRYYPDMQATQDIVRKANPEEIKHFDNALKQEISRGVKAFGSSLLYWGGTRKQAFGGHVALVTTYRRPHNPGEQGSFNVRLIRILDGQEFIHINSIL